MKDKNQGKLFTAILGVIVLIFAVTLLVMTINGRPPKLSQEKMQKKAEAAEKAEKEKKKQSERNSENETEGSEENSHSRSIQAFQVSSSGTTLSGNASGDSEKEDGKEEAETDDEDEADETDNEEESDNIYLCSYSSERLMTEADVQQLQQGTYEGIPQGKGIIRMVVNELYAKYGFQFGNEEIQAYFDRQEWYQEIPTRNTQMNEIIQKMTDTERANVEFLSPYIEEE